MEKLKRFLSNEKVEVLISLALTVATVSIYSIFAFTGFISWVNTVTDIFIGAVLAISMYKFCKIFTVEKRFRDWQYFVCFGLGIVDLGLLFLASRAASVDQMKIFLLSFIVVGAVLAVFWQFVYKPSTRTREEVLQDEWDLLVAKSRKLGKNAFLEKEKHFRAYRTIGREIKGDLDFNSPFGVIEKDGTSVALTYDGAVANGRPDLADMILMELTEELSSVVWDKE